MSLEVLSYVKQLGADRVTPIEKLILMILSDSPAGAARGMQTFWDSIENLAQYAVTTEDTVSRCLDALETDTREDELPRIGGRILIWTENGYLFLDLLVDALSRERTPSPYEVRSRAMDRAHRLVRAAIKRGELKQQLCEVCGDPNTEAHHTDYSQPLKVVWLCSNHHREAHVRMRRENLDPYQSVPGSEES